MSQTVDDDELEVLFAIQLLQFYYSLRVFVQNVMCADALILPIPSLALAQTIIFLASLAEDKKTYQKDLIHQETPIGSDL